MQKLKTLVDGNCGILRGTKEKIGWGELLKKISGKLVKKIYLKIKIN